MLTAWQRTQQSPSSGQERRCWEENVRTWERECGSEQQDVYREAFSLDAERVIKALASTLLDRAACLAEALRAHPRSSKAAAFCPVLHASKQGDEESRAAAALLQQIRSEEEARVGEGKIRGRKGRSQRTRSSEHLLGDFDAAHIENWRSLFKQVRMSQDELRGGKDPS